MVIKQTTWTLDTCGCTVTYEWDDDGNDNVDKAITFHHMDHVCSQHIDVDNALGPSITFNKVKEENERKNKLYKAYIEEAPTDLTEQVTKKDGTIATQLKSTIAFEYSFTGSALLAVKGRFLEVKFNDKTTGTAIKLKKADQDKVNAKLDSLRVDRTTIKEKA